MHYRSLPHISNSDLTEFKNLIFGYRPTLPVAAFAFGSALHQLVLEPRAQPDLPGSIDPALLQKLATQVRADRFCKWALQFSRKETVRLWRDPATGLDLKSKLDIVHRDRLVIDLKSTSQRTYPDFLRSLATYDYDRQAAFYLDSVGAKRFIFVGVQKVKPFHIWTVQYHAAGPFIESGRKKYRALLREWKRRELAGQPFTPSSWNTTAHQPERSELCY